MSHILNLMRWEWFKLRKRRMPWVILALFLGYALVSVWGNYLSYHSERTAEAHASFSLLRSLVDAANVACTGFIGMVLIIILTSSVIGTEYQWGTIRPVLAKGPGRWQYLTSKVLLIWFLVASGVLIVMATSAVSSLIAGALAGGAPEGVSASLRWVDVPVAFGKAWFVVLPYVTLATVFTVLTASWAIGMAISVCCYLVEFFVSVLLLSTDTPKWFETAVSFLPCRNALALLEGHGGFDVGETPYPSALHAFVVLIVYVLLFGGVALWIFSRRDVAAK